MGRTGELFRGSCAGEEAGHRQVPQPHSPPTPQLLLGLLIAPPTPPTPAGAPHWLHPASRKPPAPGEPGRPAPAPVWGGRAERVAGWGGVRQMEPTQCSASVSSFPFPPFKYPAPAFLPEIHLFTLRKRLLKSHPKQ